MDSNEVNGSVAASAPTMPVRDMAAATLNMLHGLYPTKTFAIIIVEPLVAGGDSTFDLVADVEPPALKAICMEIIKKVDESSVEIIQSATLPN